MHPRTGPWLRVEPGGIAPSPKTIFRSRCAAPTSGAVAEEACRHGLRRCLDARSRDARRGAAERFARIRPDPCAHVSTGPARALSTTGRMAPVPRGIDGYDRVRAGPASSVMTLDEGQSGFDWTSHPRYAFRRRLRLRQRRRGVVRQRVVHPDGLHRHSVRQAK